MQGYNTRPSLAPVAFAATLALLCAALAAVAPLPVRVGACCAFGALCVAVARTVRR
jgi:hypothetical protein